MTADVQQQIDESASSENTTIQNIVLPAEIVQICDFLSENQRIVFKSQQIDDPELEKNEKIQIAREIYTKNRQTFLTRFGGYLEERHLIIFRNLIISLNDLKTDENAEEMQLLLQVYKQKLQSRKQDVKNRRYAAMQQLIAKGEYFSEHEMMLRAPELYQELVGQYLSDIEKKQRDSYDVKNTTFSGILMHTMEQQQMADVLKEADKCNAALERQSIKATIQLVAEQENNYESDDDDDDTDKDENGISAITTLSTCEDDIDAEVPLACRQQWGNFDNEKIECSQSKHTSASKSQTNLALTKAKIKAKADATFISAGERDLLRQEFLGIMQAEFLAGNDQEFDYTQVDENTQLDDLHQLNQDKEDAYFEASDDDEINEQQRAEDDETLEEESEDELDIYMSHLSKHHSLQK